MNKEILIQIFNQHLYRDLAYLLISEWLTWWIVLALGLKLLDVKVERTKLFGALIAALCHLFLRPLLPGIFTILFLVVPLILLLRFYGKAKLLVCCWVTFLLLLITSVGGSLIETTLCSMNKNFVQFLFNTPLGISILTLIETIIPAVALLFLKIFDVSVMLSIENLFSKVNFLDVYLLCAIFYWFYDSLMKLLSNLVNNPGHPEPYLFAKWLISGGALAGIIIRQLDIKKIQKKFASHEEEKIKLQNKIQELAGINQELLNTNQQLQDKVLNTQKDDSESKTSSARSTDILPIFKKKTYKIPDKNGNPNKVKLGPSELTVLLLIGLGKSNKEIMEITGLADGTVRNKVTALLNKLKCADRTQLAIYVTSYNIMNIVTIE